MNKRKEMDIKIIRAKQKAKQAVQKHRELWYGKEPREAKRKEQ